MTVDASFPFVFADPQTQAFLENAAYLAKQQRVVPLLLGSNLLEFRSFVDCFMEHVMVDSVVWANEHRLPSLTNEHCGLVFPYGERIHPVTQGQLVRGGLQAVVVVLAVIGKDKRDLVKKNEDPPRLLDEHQGRWSQEFCDYAASTLVWPDWDKRGGDRRALLNAMLDRHTTHRGDRPELDASAWDYFASNPFRSNGTDDVHAVLRDGLTRYNNDQDSGPLTATNFINDLIRPLASTRAKPRLPSEPPTTPAA